MAFRVLINGLNIECDTSEELHRLTNNQSHGSSTRSRRERLPQWFTSRGKSGFKGTGRRLLEALTEVYPKGMTSSTLAVQLGVDTISLPANIMGLRTRAKQAGLNFNHLVKRETTVEKGMSVSIYQITEEGMKELQSRP